MSVGVPELAKGGFDYVHRPCSTVSGWGAYVLSDLAKGGPHYMNELNELNELNEMNDILLNGILLQACKGIPCSCTPKPCSA